MRNMGNNSSFLVSILLLFLTCGYCSQQCFDMKLYPNGSISEIDSEWSLTSQNGMLMINESRFSLKGVAWFGFETNNNCVHGLWAVDYHSLVDFMANYSFNGLRLPFSVYLVLNDPMPISVSTNNGLNQDLINKTSMQVMDIIIDYCAQKGILIMLDMHSLEADGYMNDGLWYSNQYPQNQTVKAWNMLVERYKNQWNVIAIDVFNEPFDGTWGMGDKSTDFNSWCETVGDMVHDTVDWLIMCEGVANSPICTDNCFWGEDLMGVRQTPVSLKKAHKLVYSPHVYGPSVAYQPYFNVPEYPNNMPAIWDSHWGFIRSINDAAITVGEWGGQYSGTDEVWMNSFVQYLMQIDARDTWFWCLNSDSGDTGGLVEDDWKTPVIPKLDLLQVLQPNPTVVTVSEKNIQTNIQTVCVN